MLYIICSVNGTMQYCAIMTILRKCRGHQVKAPLHSLMMDQGQKQLNKATEETYSEDGKELL